MAWTATILDAKPNIDGQTMQVQVRYSDGAVNYDQWLPMPDDMTVAQVRNFVKEVFAAWKQNYTRVKVARSYIGTSFPAE